MEGLAYAFLCGSCGESHNPGMACHQAAFIRNGRCVKCGLVHGNRTCGEAREILTRFTAAPADEGRIAAAPGPH